MKRDMSLIRDVLLAIQDLGTAGEVTELGLPGRSRDEVGYHVALLLDAGYLDGSSIGTKGDPYGFIVRRLTWEGHEFLDLARNEPVWRKAIARVSEAGLDVSITVFKTLLTSLVSQALGLEH